MGKSSLEKNIDLRNICNTLSSQSDASPASGSDADPKQRRLGQDFIIWMYHCNQL